MLSRLALGLEHQVLNDMAALYEMAIGVRTAQNQEHTRERSEAQKFPHVKFKHHRNVGDKGLRIKDLAVVVNR